MSDALGSNLIIEEDAAPAAKKPAIGMPASSWIILEENDDIPPTGLFLGHNGTGYLIATGVPVLVPDNVIGILDNAVTSAPVTDPTSKRVIGHRDRMRYPYRRVAAPASEE